MFSAQRLVAFMAFVCLLVPLTTHAQGPLPAKGSSTIFGRVANGVDTNGDGSSAAISWAKASSDLVGEYECAGLDENRISLSNPLDARSFVTCDDFGPGAGLQFVLVQGSATCNLRRGDQFFIKFRDYTQCWEIASCFTQTGGEVKAGCKLKGKGSGDITGGTDAFEGATGTFDFTDDVVFVGSNPSGLANPEFAFKSVRDFQGTLTFAPGKDLGPKTVKLEDPGNGATKSGIGIIRGWACRPGRLTIKFDNLPELELSTGTERNDTAQACNNDGKNGFGITVNYNNLGDGPHTAAIFDDGNLVASTDFQVVTLGDDFLTGLSRTTTVPDFPAPGKNVVLQWQESTQNFTISGK